MNKSVNRKTAKSFISAIKGAAKNARLKAFRKNMPVAVSKNGEVYLIYKNNREEKLPPEKMSQL